jgi:hypothetical protein
MGPARAQRLTPKSPKVTPNGESNGDASGAENHQAATAGSPAPAPAPTNKVADAVTATAVEEQQRAYVEGGVLRSITTATDGSLPRMDKHPEEEVEGKGTRQARARFPLLSTEPNYLHSNNPANLQAAHDKRNIGIGKHNPCVTEAKTRDILLQGLKDHVFTMGHCKKALRGLDSVRDTCLPKKLSHEAAMRAETEAMNVVLKSDTVGFDTVIKAFVKAEVSSKDKPRPIANHGEVRLYALAKVAWVFDHVLFDVLQDASIKARGKREAIQNIVTNMSSMRKGARWVENDLKAFEFGISAPLKQFEQEIFRHIAHFIGVEDSGSLLFERVVNDRDKTATWRMSYTDATGEKKTRKIILPQTMRESGDRLTSSGNFLQNLVAWFCFLVDPDHVMSALQSLLRFRGAKMFYVSPRDAKMVLRNGNYSRQNYMCMFAFEGDDTLARFQEEIWAKDGEKCPVAEFFVRWGWSPKLVWKATTGDDYARFVGYEALLCNGECVYDGAQVVMTPETKRFLKTKSWTTTQVTPGELRTCIRLFAAELGKGFSRVEPMHAFLSAMFNDNPGGCDIDAGVMKEYYLAVHGEVPEANTKLSARVEMPEFEGGDSSKWKRLLRCTAGDFTNAEWATMCHIGTVDVHGADLATSIPAKWLA